MTVARESIHGQWSSRYSFVMAAAGSAIGLGNIWKFPYITGQNGGGAFVLVYLGCILLVGIPIMMAEIMLGRRGRRSPINTMRYLAQEEGRSPLWRYLGWGGLLAGFIILSYYSVIAGWAVAYIVRAGAGMFEGLDGQQTADLFGTFVGDPERLLAWHTIFMVMVMVVVARGVKSGLEAANNVLMPALFAILIALVGYAMNTGHFAEGVRYLFEPDFSKLSGKAVLVAMGHSFFTMSLGMGAIMIYGSYLNKHTSIAKSTLAVAGANTTVALLAGLAIFPIVFAHGLAPDSGPGLVFRTLPIAFGNMEGGTFFGTLFFMLLVFAAWTSAISLGEPLVAWLVENHGMNRIKAAVVVGVAVWFIGIGSILSFNLWSGEAYLWQGKTVFELLDFLAANILLPLGGLLIALFAAWQMRRSAVQEEMAMHATGFRLWYWTLRYFTPLAVLVIFLNAIGVIEI